MDDPLIAMKVSRSGNNVSLIAECVDSNFADMMQRLFIVLMKETAQKLAPNKK